MREDSIVEDAGYYADEFDDPTRNLYLEPERRALIRTADVYQTELEVGTIGYSDKLLSVVANYRNSGRPEGFNAQSMVGKSKRGEVALRLFAVIDPETRTFRKAGFQTRGCLAVTACASVVCSMIERRTFDEALSITADDLAAELDGVPWDKSYTPHFAVCAVRALVGDFCIREGAGADEAAAVAKCDDASVACILCENCSLRSSRIELGIADAADATDPMAPAPMLAAGALEPANIYATGQDSVAVTHQPNQTNPVEPPELAEHNALARVFDNVRACSRAGALSTPYAWESAGIVPAHMTPEDLEMAVYDYLVPILDERRQHARNAERPEPRMKMRPVGIPKWFNKDDSPTPEVPPAPAPAPSNASERVSRAGKTIEAKPEPVAPASPRDEVFGALDIPQGYRLMEVDGQPVLVETGEYDAPRELAINTDGIELLMGAYGYYLYDSETMTGAYARWAFLAAEGNDEATFAELVRDESRIYPRPMPFTSLMNRPFSKTAEEIEAIWQRVQESGAYPDLATTSASNGDRFFYSTDYLTPTRAQSIAEWNAVESKINM